MSDTRRRRQSEQSAGSDDLSGSIDELNATKETQNTEPTEEQHESEYDTAGSDDESDVGSQDGAQRESGDGQEEEEEEEDKPAKKLDDDEDRRNPQYIPKRGTFYEHDDRTMEEINNGEVVEAPVEREVNEKKVWKDKDDKWDHDRFNQDEQAPKSHDELIAVYGYDIRNEEGPPRARRRRRYGRGPNKYTRNWEDEDAYGKPIANNISTQKSRRSNKTGEEFPALKGTSTINDKVDKESDEPVISSAWYSNKNKNQNKQQQQQQQQQMFPPLQSHQQHEEIQKLTDTNNLQTNENKAPNEPTNPAWKKDAKYSNDNLSPVRNNYTVDSDKTNQQYMKHNNHGNKRNQVQESVSLAASRARGRGFKPNPNNNLVGNRMETKPKGRGNGPITPASSSTTTTTTTTNDNNRRSNNTNNHHHDDQIVNDVKHMNINDGVYQNHHNTGRQNKNFYVQSNNQQQRPGATSMQPRIQQLPSQQQPTHQQQQQQPQPQQQQQQQPLPDVVANRPKRYSSLRQRPAIPDGPGQPAYPQSHNQHSQHPQHGFYSPQAGNSHGVIKSQGFPQGHFDQASPVPATAPPMAGQAVMPLAPTGQASGFAPPPFLVPPPQFIPPQTAPPSLINYVPAPNGPAFPQNFPGYQGYNPTVQTQGPPPPPPELFQPQGCTYYSPAQQSHHQQQQAVPIRRPKVAIPILPPPDNLQNYQTSRGRGRPVTNNPNNYINNSGHLMQRFDNDLMNDNSGDKVPEEMFYNAESDATINTREYRIIKKIEKNDVIQVNIDDKKIITEEKIDKVVNQDEIVEEKKLIEEKKIIDEVRVKEISEVKTGNEEKDINEEKPVVKEILVEKLIQEDKTTSLVEKLIEKEIVVEEKIIIEEKNLSEAKNLNEENKKIEPEIVDKKTTIDVEIKTTTEIVDIELSNDNKSEVQKLTMNIVDKINNDVDLNNENESTKVESVVNENNLVVDEAAA